MHLKLFSTIPYKKHYYLFFCDFSDNLLTNLVQEAVEWDKEENHNKAPSLRTDAHLNALVKCINSCGVCFSVWKKKNADGKGSGTFDFTSLMGSDKKLLLEHLPAKLEGVIRPEGSNTVTKLWKVVNNHLVCQENYTKSLDDRQEVKTKSS